MFYLRKSDSKQRSNKLTAVTRNADSILKNLFGGIIEKHDFGVFINDKSNLNDVKAHYHNKCYVLFCKKTEENQKEESPQKVKSKLWIEIATIIWADKQNDLQNGQIFYLYEFHSEFIKHLKAKNIISDDEINSIRPAHIKPALLKVCSENIQFCCKVGCPDIICSKIFNIYDFLKREKNRRIDPPTLDSLKINTEHEAVILHRAAEIIKTQIDLITRTVEYPNPSDLQLNQSENSVPKVLQIFLLWIFDHHSFLSSTYFNSDAIKSWVLNISECVIFCARR